MQSISPSTTPSRPPSTAPETVPSATLPRPLLDMPKRLVAIRHGESQANILHRAVKAGRLAAYPAELVQTPDREVRLSERGAIQAQKTGAWLREQYPDGFDVIFVSNHVRAMETAARLCQEAGWSNMRLRVDPMVGERNWGSFSRVAQDERERLMELRDRDPLHMPMPDGETLLITRLRSRTLLERCSREFAGKQVLVITHGEFIEALWAEIAHFSTEDQVAFFQSEQGDMKNCQVVEFSTDCGSCPVDGSERSALGRDGRLRWVRSSCPQAALAGKWTAIERVTYTPDELLRKVETYPKLDLESFGLSS